MKKLIHSLMLVCFLATATLPFTSCSTMQPYVLNVQAWLNDPKNQALIQEIAQAANILIGAFSAKAGATTRATVVGKLANSYPNVPAGAIAKIAQNPQDYLKP